MKKRERPIPELEKTAKAKKFKGNPSDTREGLLLLARHALAARSYGHMFQHMKKLVKIVAPANALSDDERHCFSDACTFMLRGQRDSFRRAAQAAADSVGIGRRPAKSAAELMQLIASEISETCLEVLAIINACFLYPGNGPSSSAASPESRVFYRKMKADFLRYMTEVKMGIERENFAEETFGAYISAKMEGEELPATNPIRLELNLSLAKFYTEVRCSPFDGYRAAREAVDMATLEIEAIGATATEASTRVLGCLRDYIDTLKVNFGQRMSQKK